jgi:hypothetical protein
LGCRLALFLLGFGLISLSTLAALAEALARHGAIRHHRIFLGRWWRIT